jgi:GST-like protein
MSQKLQLYSLATPNGQKIGIALEEMQLEYEAHTVNISKGEQFTEDFIKINPNSKIPALVDPSGPGGQPLSIMESGAILIYLAEKSSQFLSKDARLRSETLQWLFFQVGGVGPMFGQFGHFYKFAVDKCDHPYPLERYKTEAQRLLGVLDKHLNGRNFLVGEDYSIADMATMPWINCLSQFYKAQDILGLENYRHVNLWKERLLARPLTSKGMSVCSLG